MVVCSCGVLLCAVWCSVVWCGVVGVWWRGLGMWTSLTMKPRKPITRKPIVVAMAILRNSATPKQHNTQGSEGEQLSALARTTAPVSLAHGAALGGLLRTLGIGFGASLDESDGVRSELLDGEDGGVEAVGGHLVGRGAAGLLRHRGRGGGGGGRRGGEEEWASRSERRRCDVSLLADAAASGVWCGVCGFDVQGRSDDAMAQDS